MAKRVTTLFIRDTGVNLLAMNGKRIEKWASLPLDPGLVSQGLVVDEVQVADKVRQLFKETGAGTNRIITAVSGHDSLYRILTLPELPEAILPEAVKREARRAIPTPLEEAYFSYQRLPSPARGESRIFLATYPRNLVDALVRTLHQAGVRPYIMDLAPLALCRIPNEPRAIIVNIRLEHLDVMIIADRLPQVIRRLSLPGDTESLEERLPLIAEEFNRTVAFYNSSHIEKHLDSTVPVFVCGDLAEAPGMWPSVVGGAPYKVSALSSPVPVPERFSTNQFMVNIGLALKGLPVEKEGANFSIVNFNALPEAYVPPSFSILRVLIPVVAVVGIGLIIVAVILIMSNRTQIAALGSQVTAAETAVAQLQRDVAQLGASVASAKGAGDVLSSTIANIEQGRAVILSDLREVTRLAGPSVSLGTVSHVGGSVTINGATSDVDYIFRYARALRQSMEAENDPRFSSVWISSITDAGKAFSISLTK